MRTHTHTHCPLLSGSSCVICRDVAWLPSLTVCSSSRNCTVLKLQISHSINRPLVSLIKDLVPKEACDYKSSNSFPPAFCNSSFLVDVFFPIYSTVSLALAYTRLTRNRFTYLFTVINHYWFSRGHFVQPVR